MLISVIQNGGIVTVEAGGIIDERAASELKDKVSAIDISTAVSVIFDFKELTYIGSAGIGKLLLFYKRLAKGQTTIKMINLPEAFYDLFVQLHLDSLFTLEKAEPRL